MSSVADIIVSPCRILYANYGTGSVADTVAAAGSWGASWTELGWTETPLSIQLEREFLEHEIQESLGSVGRALISESLIIETTLKELTGGNLTLALDGVLTQTPAGASQPAKDEIVGGDDSNPTVKTWGFEGNYVSAAGNTHPVRLYIWRGTIEGGVKLEFGKKVSTGVPIRIKSIHDMTKSAGARLYKITKITAPASS